MSGLTNRREGELTMNTICALSDETWAGDENQGLIEAVFAELDEREPEGFTYKVFRLADTTSFIHVFIEHDDVTHPDSLQDLQSFQAFWPTSTKHPMRLL
jgi:hypothetical protein